MQIFSRSVLKQEGKLGELASQATKAYLQQREVAKRGGKRGKEAAGIPVPKPVIGMSAVYALPNFTCPFWILEGPSVCPCFRQALLTCVQVYLRYKFNRLAI